MPNWLGVLSEIQEEAKQSPLDRVRKKYLKNTQEHTQRNLIAYYSGWLQKPGSFGFSELNDKDKDAFMLTIHGLERTKGLDLILHTPGGDLAATESLVDYLKSMFGTDIRAIIPQLSMSAGTLIALSCKEIVMGKHSNLGPIDPQFGGIPAQEVINEWNKAKTEVQANPNLIHLWRVIIEKYHPTFLAQCKNAIDWSKNLAEDYLKSNMLASTQNKIAGVLNVFSDHTEQKSHARHISIEKCKAAGLTIVDLESDSDLQDFVLTLHHAFMHTFSNSAAVKIVENHLGVAYVESLGVAK